MSKWTYGVELEWPDVDVRTPLIPGWSWSKTDYTIVNSDGIANDPLHKLVLRGGELNSPPCDYPSILGQQCAAMWLLLRPGYNYRGNLHIHIWVPGLADDLSSLRRIAMASRGLALHWPKIDPLDGLLAYQPAADLKHAHVRMKHSAISRHYLMPNARHLERMAQSTVEGFMAAHVPMSKGKPQWHLNPREAINLRSLRKHGTVEFRCFAAPSRAQEVVEVAEWCRSWLGAVLDDSTPGYNHGNPWPHQAAYIHELEVGWQWTNLQHNSRKTVEERLRAWNQFPQINLAPSLYSQFP